MIDMTCTMFKNSLSFLFNCEFVAFFGEALNLFAALLLSGFLWQDAFDLTGNLDERWRI